MMVIDNTIVSDEFRDARFCCDVQKCMGACCVEGDAGAPLEEEEIALLEENFQKIRQYMRLEGVKVVYQGGVFDYDSDGTYVTPLINGRDCAYVYYENGVARCAIEKAYDEGRIDFKKPVSCHLYPVRITKHKEFDAINYHKWNICTPARASGKKNGVKLYEFLREALIRKYGEGWYKRLKEEIEGIPVTVQKIK